ncbi:hypothetical protein DDJ69_32320, partial [Klebsiella oxytoca]
SEAERFIDRFSQWYTPAVLVLALIVGLISQNIELAIKLHLTPGFDQTSCHYVSFQHELTHLRLGLPSNLGFPH